MTNRELFGESRSDEEIRKEIEEDLRKVKPVPRPPSRYDDAPRRPDPDGKTGEQLRDMGTAAVLGEEDDLWKVKAWAGISALAKNRESFNADDLRELVGAPKKPNAMGALFLRAVQQNIIENAGYVKMKRPGAHARRTAVYRRPQS